MEKLSKIYRSPRCSKYQRAWTAAERNPPCMPYVGHFLIKVLGLNGLREIRANFASSTRKQSSTQTGTLEPNHKNFKNISTDGQKIISERDGFSRLARRIFTATLAKIKFTTHRNIADEVTNNIWTRKQRYLARKFFYRWRIITFESKTFSKDEKKSKNVDMKRKHVLNMAIWLTNCQRFAQNYNFPLNSFACEFLLKARYREDRENFFISLKLEPSKTTWTVHIGRFD